MNATTIVNVNYRMSANASLLENASWSTWSDVPFIFEAYGAQYFQVKALLTTNAVSETPT